MHLIAFKLLMPPLLILLASLAGRRWGEAVGGWLVGLPLTSGPVSAFLAVQYGAGFAALATNGSLVGAAAQGCFCLGYALLARRGWETALLGGLAAYAGVGVLFQAAPLPHWEFFALALAALTLSAAFIPRLEAARIPVAAPWWDLPARMGVATALVVALTAAAALVGAKMAGVLASFPVFGAILAIFAHRTKGAETATEVLRGMVMALFGFAAFFFVLGWALTAVGPAPAFFVATAATLLVQTGALRLVQSHAAPRAA